MKIQLKRSSTAHWAATNPVLAAGEVGVDIDSNRFKIGDGVNAWADLPYYVTSNAQTGTGRDGATWLADSGAPASSAGNDLDLYFDTQTGDVYRKTLGTWTLIGNIQGQAGADGLAGPRGERGLQGPQGEQGEQGIQGQPGVQGVKGDRGDQGEPGVPGIQGEQGIPGPVGKGFKIAKIYDQLSTLLSDTTPTGIDTGEFALISTANVDDADNAKLYVWDGSSYSYVADLSGAQGIQGPQGERGIQGPVGERGEQGIQGNPGEQGIQGIEGPQGIQGPAGESIIFTGNYSAGRGYTAYESCLYNGSTWVATSSVSPGFAPNESNSAWQLLASKGDQGAQGDQGQAGPSLMLRGEYQPGRSYSPYDVVSYNGSSYVVKNTVGYSAGVRPVGDADSETNWQLIAQAGTNGTNGMDGLGVTWRGDYDPAARYHLNDAVYYQGSSYIVASDSGYNGQGMVGEAPTMVGASHWSLLSKAGTDGATGATGAPGADGVSHYVYVGDVTSGATASVTNRQVGTNVYLDFVLPKGDTGPKGADTVSVAIGTVSTGATPSVTNTGTGGNAVLNFVIPAGQTGDTGPSGPQGIQGPKGDTGQGFRIAKTYSSVSALTADTNPSGIVAGEFAMIETGNVNNAENSRLYLWSGSAWSYISDLSGAQGIQGPAGSVGAQGPTGATGPAGTAATVSVGTVTTGAAGSSATVTNSGTSSAAVLDFSIPRGAAGADGAAGTAATVSVGTVTTGAAGSSATVTNSGTSSAAVLNFAIPRGATGADGATGATGATGPAGSAATVSVGTVTTGAAGSSATVTNSGSSSAAVLNFTIPRGATGADGATGATGTAATVSVGTVTQGEAASVSNSGTSSAAVLDFTVPTAVKNYVSNPHAITNTTGWSTYADAAGTTPVDATGGTAQVTWTRSTTNPLRGAAHFVFTKDAANRQGQGVSTDFTIENADLARVLTVSFDYEVGSGTYSSGDVTVYLVKDTAGSPVVIQPAGYSVQAVSGTKMRHVATFQTDATVKTYRLALHVASTSTSAYTLNLDNFAVSPQSILIGAPVTDPVDYVPTFVGLGTVTQSGMGLRWWRSGANLHVQGDFTIGTVTATTASFSLPSGLTANVAAVSGNYQIIGKATCNSVVTPQAKDFNLLITNGASTVNFSICEIGNATNPLAPQTGSAIFPNGSVISVNLVVQITGWASSVQMSSDTDTRVVAAAAENQVSATYSTSAPLDFSTIRYDSHGAVTTGSAWKYTAQVAGYYRVSVAGTRSSITGASLNLYKNGVSFTTLLDYPSTANYRASGTATISLNAGDYIDLRPSGSQATIPGYFSVERVSGPATIAASEFVGAKYYASASQTISATAACNFDTKVYDTHGAVTTGSGTAWVFTAPVVGKYRLTVFLNNSNTVTGSIAGVLWKSGAALEYFTALSASVPWNSGSTTIDLNAGETLQVRTSSSYPLSGGARSAASWIAIEKID